MDNVMDTFDVAEDGQLSIGVAGEQRPLDGLAPAAPRPQEEEHVHTSFDEVLERAERLDDTYQRATLELAAGDTAPSCASTKWDIRAGKNGATVEYLISPNGVDVRVTAGSIGRSYITERAR